MNEKFYTLPPPRQQRMIDAGYRVFAQNPYRKAPMAAIAAEAGVSKSLLFHYFRNKLELYAFLWGQACCAITRQLRACFAAMGIGAAAPLKLRALQAARLSPPPPGPTKIPLAFAAFPAYTIRQGKRE